MFARTLASMLALVGTFSLASAAEFFPFQSQESLYPRPIIVGGAGVPPSQVDYNNAFIELRQYQVLPGGAGTQVFGGNVRVSDLVATSPAFQQLQQIQLISAQYAIQAQAAAVRAQRGVTAAAAMANIWMPSAPGRTAWAVNAATFLGEFGGGISIAHRLNFSVPIAITAAYGNGAGNAHVARVGLMGEF